MDFFERQELARGNSRKIVLLFLLALPGVVAAVYLVSLVVYAVAWGFFAFWRSVSFEIQPAHSGAIHFNIGFWQPKLLLGVAGATLLVVLCGSLYKMRQLAPGGKIVALLLGGERLNGESRKLDEMRLIHVVEEMAVASGTPMPDIYVLRGQFGLNAFVAGHAVSDMVVCVTEGCLRELTRDEMQGVIAHEYSHIFHGDMRLNMRLMGLVHGLFCITLSSYWVMSRTYRESDRDIGGNPEVRTGVGLFADLVILVIGFVLAFIGWNGAFFGRIIKGAVSRQREFLADAAAVQFTRYPEGLANALRKVRSSPETSIIRSPRTEEASHIFFCNGLEEDRMWLTSTHPPLDERIKRIQRMMGGSFAPEAKALKARTPERGAEIGELGTKPRPTDQPTPDPSQEGSRRAATPQQFPSWEGSGVGPRPPYEIPASGGGPFSPSPSDGKGGGDRQSEGALISRLFSRGASGAGAAAADAIEAKDALANLGVPVALHLAYARRLMDALPEPVRLAAREPRGATALIYVLLLNPIESVREAQVRMLKPRIGSEGSLKMSALLSSLRDLNELIKIPLLELALPALRRLSLAEYAAFRENIAALIAADQQVDLFEFALQKMLRRHLEPKFNPVPQPEVRYSRLSELSGDCSTVLSALAHAGQDTIKDAQAAFKRGATELEPDDGRLRFVALAECTFSSIESALNDLAQATGSSKKIFLGACAQTVAADGRIRPREAELLRAIADSLDCPMPPLVA